MNILFAGSALVALRKTLLHEGSKRHELAQCYTLHLAGGTVVVGVLVYQDLHSRVAMLREECSSLGKWSVQDTQLITLCEWGRGRLCECRRQC